MRMTVLLPVALVAGCSDERASAPADTGNGIVVEAPDVPENQVFNTAAPVIARDVAGNASDNAVANQAAPASPLANESFVASGNEPFWTISVDTKRAKLTTPEDQKGTWFPVKRSVDGSTVRIMGSVGGKAMTLVIEQKPCQDDMSGARFPFSAKLTASLAAGPGTWSGCARRLSDPQPKPE